jgi:ceramide glucosyltransferase
MELFHVFAGLAAVGLIVYAMQIWAVRSSLKKENSGTGGCQFPPVSILKPLKGLDDNLLDNLESFCRLDYPEYEVIFSIYDHNDPAYKIARKIKEKHKDRKIAIVVERCGDGLNPKVNNLIPAYKFSQYEHILISDSNVMVRPDYLKEIVRRANEENVGLVCNLIRGTGGHNIGAILENLHLNSFIMGSVCFLDKFLKMPCVIGKSMLMRKRDLEAIGGFASVKDILAEDYVIGDRMHKAGKKVVVSNHMIDNVNEYWGMKRFVNRHTRWGKLRWKIGGVKYLSELINNPVFISCIPLLFLEATAAAVSFALTVSVIKVIGDYHLGRNIGSKLNPLHYLLSPLKDVLIGIIWFVPILSNTVVWRGNRYLIGKNSILSPYPESGFWSWRYRLVDAIKARFA